MAEQSGAMSEAQDGINVIVEGLDSLAFDELDDVARERLEARVENHLLDDALPWNADVSANVREGLASLIIDVKGVYPNELSDVARERLEARVENHLRDDVIGWNADISAEVRE